MIPEIHRKIPDGIFGNMLWQYANIAPSTRCIRKYGKPEDHHTVLDVGAYIGEFSIPASVYAKKVYSIEPSEVVWRLGMNTGDIDNIEVHNHGIWNVNGPVTFDIKDDTADSCVSEIGVDTKAKFSKTVMCMRLDSLDFIDEIDFLKIDGEGAEAEIITSLGDYRPENISVDITEQRKGESVQKPAWILLEDMGYSVVYNNGVLKAEI